MRRAFLLLLALLPLPVFAAVRLPQTVIPSHYDITMIPALGPETFSGGVTIEADVKSATDEIMLHAVDLTLRDITVKNSGREFTATTTTNKDDETVTLKLNGTLAPGPVTIHIGFDGKLLPNLRGLYLSTTAKRKYAVTQFESTSARRAFPCFDEPAMKATFRITIITEPDDVAISNAPIKQIALTANGKHVVQFEPTRKMSTYLVAMLVGDFQCISGSADGIPIRVCATPGLQNLGHFALDAAKASVTFFDQYYGIKYPFGKLDLIGIPDFAAGAMENAGAITFRETDLLVDTTSSELVKRRVASVVAHEIAHQWFGDLVTMQWWNDLWLNEGFATFMSEKPVMAWKPEWHTELDKPANTFTALTTDSSRSTRPIRLPASVTGEGGFGDAGITYGKTASVLRMVESWIGETAFRDAIRTYLKKYSWGNAAAEDFWGTMKASSSQPVDVVLQSFIDTTGAPLLHVTRDGNTVTIAQERLMPGVEKSPVQSWTIPICPHGTSPCTLVTKDAPSLQTAQRFLNRNGAGYYLTDYPAADRLALRKHMSELTAKEQIAHHANEWLLVRTNHRDAGEYLRLLQAIPRPGSRPLVTAIAENLVYLNDRLVTDATRPKWETFVRDVLRGHAPFTWTAPKNETVEQRISRASVLWTLGYAARDPQVIAGAKKIADVYMNKPSAVDALIADRALRLSAVYGDEAFLARVIAQYEQAKSPEMAARYRNLLPLFRDAKAAARATDYIYSDKIRTQDIFNVVSAQFTDPLTRGAAWTGATGHWADIEKRGGQAGGRILGATGLFCDPESRNQLTQFFESRPQKGSRGLTRATDAIDACIAFRTAQEGTFSATVNEGAPTAR